LKFLFRKLL